MPPKPRPFSPISAARRTHPSTELARPETARRDENSALRFEARGPVSGAGGCESGGRDGERGAARQSAHAVPTQGAGRGGTWRRGCSSSRAGVSGTQRRRSLPAHSDWTPLSTSHLRESAPVRRSRQAARGCGLGTDLCIDAWWNASRTGAAARFRRGASQPVRDGRARRGCRPSCGCRAPPCAASVSRIPARRVRARVWRAAST
jgi:hypothetical protein